MTSDNQFKKILLKFVCRSAKSSEKIVLKLVVTVLNYKLIDQCQALNASANYKPILIKKRSSLVIKM